MTIAVGGCLVILGGSFGIGQLIHIPGRDGTLIALAWALVLLAPLDWIAIPLAVRLVQRAPDVRSLQDQYVRLLFEVLAATMIGASGLSYLLPVIPRVVSSSMLIFGLLLVSAALIHWTFHTYRKA